MSLDGDHWAKVENNPHCMEIFLNSPPMDFFVNPVFSRTLEENAEEMEYRSSWDMYNGNMRKTRLHWGQRKLLMAEIEFLTLIGRENLRDALVVYAGAAPGTHMTYLCGLFPEVKFLLVDPAPFQVKASAQVAIIYDLFTDEMARVIASVCDVHTPVYFISDVRSTDPTSGQTREIMEGQVFSDHVDQMRWHELMGSRRSMLKFRLPWNTAQTEYLDGDIYLPVWGTRTTTECRLITHEQFPCKKKVYDNVKLERQMMYFNNVTRHSLFPHRVVGGEGIDHCYDCTAECHILGRYLEAYPERQDAAKGVCGTVSDMSRGVSRRLSSRRTLLDPVPDKEVRRAGIRRSQYRNGEPAHVEAYRKRFGESGEEYKVLGEIDLLLSVFEDVGVGASCR